MNLRADATLRWGDFATVEALIVPKLMKGVQAGTLVVYDASQALVAVDTGELKASGTQRIEWSGMKIKGYVSYSARHAAFVEFGTGRRGAGSTGAGPWTYNLDWPGMIAQPYLRPALDYAKPRILQELRSALAV